MANDSKVNWREWNDEAFADAKAQDKPVLLGIGAVWCHWCHVMDRGVPGDPVHTGVYNNQQLADYINANYIPVRVDNDQRPDINARYNMGGWPTTCFLTPDGDVIYGGTYFAPSQMRQLLPRVVEVWQTDRKEILSKLGERETAEEIGDKEIRDKTEEASSAVRRLSSSANDIISSVVTLITRNFDPKHGGLGNDQKFPMSDAWALLLAAHSQPVTNSGILSLLSASRRTKDADERNLLDMVTQTLIAMGTQGMYDLVAGGWFRYSTTPDWSVPHFEKMLEDHARLLPVYLSAIQILNASMVTNVVRGDSGSLSQRAERPVGKKVGVRESLTKITRASLTYLTTTLLHDENGLTYFAGSQDADEEYSVLSRDERAKLTAPFIDWRLYVDWNALMVSALLQASVVLDEPQHADLAKRIWRTLVARCVNADGSVTHSLVECEGAMQPTALRGQLGDQAVLAKASLDMAQYAPDMRDECFAVARSTLAFAMTQLSAPGGGFYDSLANPDAKGMLRTRIQPIFDNCTMADALLTMSYLDDDNASRLRELAQQTLAAFIDEYPRYREHGAPYALAALRATQEPDETVIVADVGDHTGSPLRFIHAAHAAYSPWRIVRALDKQRDAEVIAQRGYPVSRTPVAFVCKGTSCSAPIYEAEKLGEI